MASAIGTQRHVPFWRGKRYYDISDLENRALNGNDVYWTNKDARGDHIGPSWDQLEIPYTPDFNEDEYLKLNNKKFEQRHLWARHSPRDRGNYSTVVLRPQSYDIQNITVPAAAVATDSLPNTVIYYPHIPSPIMTTALIPGPNFKWETITDKDAKLAEATMALAIKENQESKESPKAHFKDIISIPEISDIILENLGFIDRGKLFAVNKEMAGLVSRFQTFYDIGTEDCALLQNSQFGPKEVEIFKQHVDADKINCEAPRGAKNLFVSRSRLEFDESTGFRKEASWTHLGYNIVHLTRSFALRGRSIEFLTLHRVPFADYKVMLAWIDCMPNLRSIEIVACEQFTIDQVVPFLTGLQTINEKHGKFTRCDISPRYDPGPRWANFESGLQTNGSGSNHHVRKIDRTGTYGCASTDHGIKINVAVAKWMRYDILPTLIATNQMHMVTNTSSMFRQYLEALPLPRYFVPRTLACYRIEYGLKREIFAAERKYAADQREAEARRRILRAARQNNLAQSNAAQSNLAQSNAAQSSLAQIYLAQNLNVQSGPVQEVIDPEDDPNFRPNPSHWTQDLRDKEAGIRVWLNFGYVIATLGEKRWLETKDMSSMSENFRCTPNTYRRWAPLIRCVVCDVHMPAFYFDTATACNACRLQVAIYEEGDQLKRLKLSATSSLGCGAVGPGTKAEHNRLAESNFRVFTNLYAADHTGQVQCRMRTPTDFDHIVGSPNGLLDRFFNMCNQMTAKEILLGPVGRMQKKQTTHPHSGYAPLGSSHEEIRLFEAYKRPSTVEEYRDHPDGLDAANPGWFW